MPITNSNLRSWLEQLAAQTEGQLVHEDFGAHFNFREATKIIQEIKSDLFAIRDNWDKLNIPQKAENQITSIASNLFDISGQIINFRLENNSNPGDRRQSMINQVKDIHASAFHTLKPIVHEITFKNLTPENIFSAQKDLQGQIETSRKLNIESTKILESLRSVSGTTGTAVSSKIFEDQADKHKAASQWWLGGSIVTFVATFYTAYASLTGLWPFKTLSVTDVAAKSSYEIIHVVVIKIVLISLIYLTLYQCLKNYNAQKHLEIVNTHRHNALGIYPHMVNAAEKELRQIILKEASHSIFDSSGTGYLTEDKTPPPLNFNEIVNKMPDLK
jgi:hypothetical protein